MVVGFFFDNTGGFFFRHLLDPSPLFSLLFGYLLGSGWHSFVLLLLPTPPQSMRITEFFFIDLPGTYCAGQLKK